MPFSFRRLRPLAVSLVAAGTLTCTTWISIARGGSPTVEQALKLAPIQKDVEYDIPTAAEIAKCAIKAEKVGNQTGWVVRGPSGQILREFVDTNGDNVVDRWSYFKDGIEVYRDIDENYN